MHRHQVADDGIGTITAGGGGEAAALSEEAVACVGFSDNATIAYSRAHGITTQSYSPLGGTQWGGKSVMDLPEVQAFAAQLGKSAAQVALRYILEKNVTIATQSTNAAHLNEDADIFDWRLTAAEVARLEEQ